MGAVGLFRSLLWCAAHRQGVPPALLTISMKVDVPDGGVDAEVAANRLTVEQDLLVSGDSFYQIKAGTSAAPWQKGWLQSELFGPRTSPSRASLGAAVRDCLSKRGRYVIVCFGADPTGQQRQRAVGHLRTLLRSCGYRAPRVDVWGQSTIAGLIRSFPSLVLRLADRDHLPFQTIEEWRLDAAMAKPFHPGKRQQAVMDQIRLALRGRDVGHVRLVGEPGLGKTRLALESLSADDLAPMVLYVRHPDDFQRSPLFNTVLRAGDVSAMIVVIDDCPAAERASIWSVLRERGDRVRLVTLDHGPDDSSDDRMAVIPCPPLEPAEMKAIIGEYVGAVADVDRWAEFCSGSPRVAHAVGENLARNPGDVLKSPATVPIWERFVHGNLRPGTHEAGQRETVLRHVALFHKFGFEHPVDAEARFIASLAAEADPTITWPRFQSIVKHYRDRRILQGKTTLFLVPRLLHVYLWQQFWEHHGRGLDVAALMGRMPQSLFRWFTEMFVYGHTSPACVTRIEHITAPGGPFDDPRFITNGPGAAFLNELAEAHPEATLRCIERTIGRWSTDALASFAQHRQYVVWALEKIAIWREFFSRAAAVLLKLAAAENAPNSNNATGTFCGLFGMGFGQFAPSEASPAERLPSLRAALTDPSPEIRAIGFKALAGALADHPYSKAVGPERQGVRPLPRLWTPLTYGEIYDAYRTAWALARGLRGSATGRDKADVAKVMVDAAFVLVQKRWIEAEILDALEEMRADPDTDLRPIVQLIARYRRLRWGSLSRKAAAGLRRLDDRITGRTAVSRLRRLTLLATWDDLERSRDGIYGKGQTREIAQLAPAVMRRPAVLEQLLSELSGAPGFMVGTLGRAIADADPAMSWWPRISGYLTAAGDTGVPDLAAGYLAGVYSRDVPLWERLAREVLDGSGLRRHTRALVIGSGLTEAILDDVCKAIEQERVPPAAIDRIGYTGRLHGVGIGRIDELIAWCVKRPVPDLARIGLQTAYLAYCFDKQAPVMPEQPLLDLITSPLVFEGTSRNQSLYWEWGEVAAKFLRSYPQYRVVILDKMLSRFDDHRFMLNAEHSAINTVLLDAIRADPKASWEVVARHLSACDDEHVSNVVHWLGPPHSFGDRRGQGPISLFGPDDVLAWVGQDPAARAPWIADACPPSLAPAEGGELTRQVIERYGHLDGVIGGIWGTFHSDGWCGNASEHYRKRRDEARAWLGGESSPSVVRWLEEYIDDLGRRIAAYEIEEERRY